MSAQREDNRMLGRKSGRNAAYDPTSHEVFHGPVRAGKTSLARTFLEEGDITETGIETWVIDPFFGLAETKTKVDRYAHTTDDIDELLATLLAETFSRAEQIAGLALAEFTRGDDRHNLPLISVTIDDADHVLQDFRRCRTIEQVIRMSRRAGIRLRLVVPHLMLSAFGGSELIRSSISDGNLFACERASI